MNWRAPLLALALIWPATLLPARAGDVATVAAATPAAAAGVPGADSSPAVPAAAVPAAVGPAIATDARLAGDEERTRLVMDLSRPVPFGAFALADPYRVVVDIPDVVFTVPPSAGQQGRGLVSAFRFGLFAPGKARLVIDVTDPVKIDKVFVIDPIDGQPARLVVDLVKTDRVSFMKSVAAPVQRAQAAPVLPAPPVTNNDGRPVIVLDPGHGGIDAGAVNASAGIYEKDVVLSIATLLRKKLDATGRYRVVMTRDGDTFVPLGDRVKVARDQQARLFISLHADSLAARSGQVRGATVYTLSDRASDAEAQRLADAENRADMIAGLDLSDEPTDVAGILLDLAQRETKNFSALFARTLVGKIDDVARMHKSPLKSAGFKVLKAPDVPSVLFELGYLSSEKDVELMTSDAWKEKVTDAMVTAINAYFASQGGSSAPVAMP
ncbi:N-acetylmuramoyl-L-alanine amidase [Ancylobacter sp. 6x-1]|uniref:N-acetylmuramoyl-L-alanine amidase n=1 Tax=Ancylobacter crimeensis TaxID=2579147 RepID=A0ABT0D6A0_9HYPH|nr:N-acetylmuramoyl-L-alanine amidase [Ancylobacter crimeensis]MCK0195476.1 N-acetylmuramoyl-L-alanine amidase [Ancylobacter crimeensis]